MGERGAAMWKKREREREREREATIEGRSATAIGKRGRRLLMRLAADARSAKCRTMKQAYIGEGYEREREKKTNREENIDPRCGFMTSSRLSDKGTARSVPRLCIFPLL